MASQATPTSAAELLRIREARWLRVPVIARFVFIGFGALSLFGSGLSPSMMILICVALGIVIGVNLYFLHLLRKVRRLELVGLGGVMLDALNMIAGRHLVPNLGSGKPPRSRAKDRGKNYFPFLDGRNV